MTYRKLQIWTKSMALAKLVYKQTAVFPAEEKQGLQLQIRQAAVAIPAAVAEGSQCASDKEFAHFVLKAKGLLAKLHTQLTLAMDLECITPAKLPPVTIAIQELDRSLYEFASKLTNLESLARESE